MSLGKDKGRHLRWSLFGAAFCNLFCGLQWRIQPAAFYTEFPITSGFGQASGMRASFPCVCMAACMPSCFGSCAVWSQVNLARTRHAVAPETTDLNRSVWANEALEVPALGKGLDISNSGLHLPLICRDKIKDWNYQVSAAVKRPPLADVRTT